MTTDLLKGPGGQPGLEPFHHNGSSPSTYKGGPDHARLSRQREDLPVSSDSRDSKARWHRQFAIGRLGLCPTDKAILAYVEGSRDEAGALACRADVTTIAAAVGRPVPATSRAVQRLLDRGLLKEVERHGGRLGLFVRIPQEVLEAARTEL